MAGRHGVSGEEMSQRFPEGNCAMARSVFSAFRYDWNLSSGGGSKANSFELSSQRQRVARKPIASPVAALAAIHQLLIKPECQTLIANMPKLAIPATHLKRVATCETRPIVIKVAMRIVCNK